MGRAEKKIKRAPAVSGEVPERGEGCSSHFVHWKGTLLALYHVL